MVTAPLFIIFAIVAFVAVKWGPATPGVVLLGMLLGLSLASTSIGGPILSGLETASASAIQTVTNAVGGAR